MLAFIENERQVKELYLYYPNSKVECTVDVMNFFRDNYSKNRFGKMSENEQIQYGTKALYKFSDVEIFNRLSDILSKFQSVINRFAEKGILGELTIIGIPVFINTVKS